MNALRFITGCDPLSKEDFDRNKPTEIVGLTLGQLNSILEIKRSPYRVTINHHLDRSLHKILRQTTHAMLFTVKIVGQDDREALHCVAFCPFRSK